ncbi:MAG: hypothetical protein JXB13_15430 [Phycisphaerae bacterium]|nr:hypothetical protein [Phycisphaerae bacterium]
MQITKNFSAAVVGLLVVGTMAWGIELAHPNAPANARKVLADHGVAVLWRLFNEARDGKWWCLQPAARYQTLYRYTFYYMKKLRCVKETLRYCSFLMSWDRVWGPFGRGTPDSVKAMYNDPTVANRGDLDWRHTNTNRREEIEP